MDPHPSIIVFSLVVSIFIYIFIKKYILGGSPELWFGPKWRKPIGRWSSRTKIHVIEKRGGRSKFEKLPPSEASGYSPAHEHQVQKLRMKRRETGANLSRVARVFTGLTRSSRKVHSTPSDLHPTVETFDPRHGGEPLDWCDRFALLYIRNLPSAFIHCCILSSLLLTFRASTLHFVCNSPQRDLFVCLDFSVYNGSQGSWGTEGR